MRPHCLEHVLAVIVVVGWTSGTFAESKPDSRTMEVLITDEAGAPLEGATLHVSIWEIDDKDDFPNRDYVADAHGKMQVSLPVRLRILRIWPNKPGYVPEFLNFSEGTHDDGQLIPDKFHFKLARGTKLGGTVVDESGDPIAGVAVNVSVEVREPAWGKNPDPMISTWLTDSDFGEGSVMTDKEGRWSIDNAPGQVGAKDFEFRTKFMHPEFIRDTRWGELQGKQGVTTKQLRDASARIVLRRGIPVTGTVVDASDKPVRAGIVIWNERPYWADGTNETRLETSGHFKTIPLSPGKYPITVVAQGYRPEQRIVTVDKSLEAQRFVLQPGKRLIMKVVDTSGAPLPQAYVSLGQWRNSESLYNHRHPNVLDSGIPTRANDEGVYIWDWAPDDAVTYEVTAKGHGSTSVTLVANGQEHVVKVLPRLVFSGQVTDAKSGAPIPEFRVIPVTVFRPKFLSTSYGNSVLGKNGEYETSVWTSSERDYRYQLRIEAEGYRSAMCEQTYEPADGAVDIDFSLEPAAARAGIVVGPDGRPVANASIVAGTPSVVPMMSNTDLESASEAPDIKTAVDGRFHLAATFEPERIRVIHESGFAEVLLEPDDEIGTIELAPWASVSGQLVHDGQPVKNETIYFTPVLRRQLGEPRFQDSYYCQTDGDGRFQFERLPAIAGTVKAYLGPWQDSPLTSSQAIPLDLQPGEQRTIALGNDGITITGKVVATGRGNAPLNQNFSLNYLISRDRKVKFPEGFPQLGFDPAAQVEASWFLDQNYHNWLETREHYFVKPSPDGDVHICGVPQGRYDLVLRLYEQPVGCLVQTVGERVVAVDVTAADVAAGVKDIGNIEVPCRVGPQVGENMQLYKFVDVTGRERTLKELSGRHVLMHVWASWCAPCLESMPDIQATVGQLSDESVTFVGLNVDDKNSEAKALAERHGWNWPQSYLGEDSDVARQLAISSVPAYFLIGPDGRLIVSAAEWSEIKEKMEAAISSGVHD